MVSGMLAAQAGNTQMQVATTILKSNADAEKSAVLTLLGRPAERVVAGQCRRRHRRQSRYHGLELFCHSGIDAKRRTRNLEIPGSRFRAPGMTKF